MRKYFSESLTFLIAAAVLLFNFLSGCDKNFDEV